VLLIISIVVGLVVPRFRDSSQQNLVSHARRLAMTFRYLRQTSVGMDKEQVAILLGNPLRRSAEAPVMEKEARRFWPELKEGVSEVWVYPLGWNLFFKDDKLVEIVQYQE